MFERLGLPIVIEWQGPSDHIDFLGHQIYTLNTVNIPVWLMVSNKILYRV